MAKDSWAGTASSAEIVAADDYREYLTIQLTNATQVALGFGEAAVANKGVQLINAGDAVRLRGAMARKAVYAIGNGATGTYQDGDAEYSPGPQVAS
jgi:hypothetical protein